MVEFDPSQAETFEFKVGKKAYSVPGIRSMPFSDYRELIGVIDGAPEGTQRVRLIEKVIDIIESHAPGSTKGLSVAQADQLVSAYMKGGETGE